MQRANHHPATGRLAPLLLAAVLGVGLLAVHDAPAEARAGKPAAARKSKAALAHFLKGEFERAAALYHEAHRMSGAAKYLYNIGLCYYKLGRYGPALQMLRKFQRLAGTSVAAAYLSGAAKKIAEILRITRLVSVDVEPDGARIVLDGRPPVISPIPGRIRLRNGQHTLLVTHAGHLTVQRTFQVGPGHPDTVKVRLRRWSDPRRRGVDPGSGGVTPRPQRRAPTPLPAPQPGPRTRRSVVWLALAVTGTVLAVAGEGLAWGLWASHAGGDKTSNRTFGYLYYVGHGLAVVGAALAVTGFVLHFRKPAERAQHQAEARWIPVVTAGPGGAYAGVGGTF
jgi:hypothetical protein